MAMMDDARAGKALTATFDTTEGQVVVNLFAKDAPKTVENFVGLATGEKPWTDPNTSQKKTGVPLYDWLIFHRAKLNLKMSGGDALRTGGRQPLFRSEV